MWPPVRPPVVLRASYQVVLVTHRSLAVARMQIIVLVLYPVQVYTHTLLYLSVIHSYIVVIVRYWRGYYQVLYGTLHHREDVTWCERGRGYSPVCPYDRGTCTRQDRCHNCIVHWHNRYTFHYGHDALVLPTGQSTTPRPTANGTSYTNTHEYQSIIIIVVYSYIDTIT